MPEEVTRGEQGLWASSPPPAEGGHKLRSVRNAKKPARLALASLAKSSFVEKVFSFQSGFESSCGLARQISILLHTNYTVSPSTLQLICTPTESTTLMYSMSYTLMGNRCTLRPTLL